MMLTGVKQPNEFIGRKRKVSRKLKIEGNEMAYITYKLDKKYKRIILFGKKFVENNEKNWKIVIGRKEYDLVGMINVKEFKKYGIKKKDETLKIILKGEKINDMSCMFMGSRNLIKIDLSSINTKNVTDMSYMFRDCNSLTNIDLSSFNTQNVTDMSYMFSCCVKLSKIDLSSFNTQNVTDMSYIFSNCYKLVEVSLLLFNTQNLTNMSNMFSTCHRLTNVDLS